MKKRRERKLQEAKRRWRKRLLFSPGTRMFLLLNRKENQTWVEIGGWVMLL
jgi:hypothetical protein